MKQVFTFAFAMLLALQTFTSSANNTDNPKEKKSESNVSSAIKGLLESHDFGDLSATEGRVIIRYVVNQENRMNILDISGSHPALKEHVYRTLNGRKVDAEGIEANKENILKLNFSLHSN